MNKKDDNEQPTYGRSVGDLGPAPQDGKPLSSETEPEPSAPTRPPERAMGQKLNPPLRPAKRSFWPVFGMMTAGLITGVAPAWRRAFLQTYTSAGATKAPSDLRL